ncbi:MAG: hypothetical protein QOJ79_2334 [Actinomycetota bacterium]|jgi:hypothetical protein|nr:hypothetical protein [Actinomycetota bacterium]
MRVGIRAALVGLTVIATAAPAVAQAAPSRTVTVQRMYSFDGVGDAVLLVSGTIDPGKGRGLFATVTGEADKTGGVPRDVFFPQVIDLDTRGAHTYGAIGDRDLCKDPQTVCGQLADGTFGFGTSFTVTGDDTHQWHVRFAIVARGAKVTIKEKMIGWRGHDLRGIHQLTDDDAQGAGVAAVGATAGATLTASAPAGAKGSVAIAAPQCDVVGAGAVVLSGPSGTTPGLCPTDAFGASADHGGTWDVTGPVAGVASRSTRLLVLDL